MVLSFLKCYINLFFILIFSSLNYIYKYIHTVVINA